MTPLASVWTCSYNHAPYLPAAIESVLGQTLQDVEYVIVDDGSCDGSVAIAERYAAAHPGQIRVLTHPGHVNLGIAATANLGRSQVRGRYMLGLPSDDVLYRDTLEREVDFLERHPDVGYVYGYADLMVESGRGPSHVRRFGVDLTRGGRTVERLVQGNKIPGMTLMFRRECLEQAGEEDETLVYSDWEFFTRAAAHWGVGFLPRRLAIYRGHGANTSMASRATNVERAIEVTEAFRERAVRVGGRLAEPRVRAALDLQMGFLRFASGDESGAVTGLRGAFERDPSLDADGRWLGDWLWNRLLEEQLPDSGPEFVPWFTASVTPLLGRRAARTFRRRAATAEAAARVIRLARTGRSVRAHRAALAAVARSPRRVADRRLGALLLDSVAGGVPATRLRSRRRLRDR